jgi:hypothetical protein
LTLETIQRGREVAEPTLLTLQVNNARLDPQPERLASSDLLTMLTLKLSLHHLVAMAKTLKSLLTNTAMIVTVSSKMHQSWIGVRVSWTSSTFRPLHY